MPMHLDFAEDPHEKATPIRLGFRKRPADEVIQELGEYVLPYFPPHKIEKTSSDWSKS